jgi:hypothetical protein
MTSLLIISPCHFPIAAGVALDVIGRWVAQLFHDPTLADFSCCLWKAENETIAVFIVYLEFLPLPLETG